VIPRIRTERLLLREWLESDREPYAALNADPDVMRFMPRSLDRAESDAMIDRIGGHWDTDGHGLWAIERLRDGSFIGFVGLTSPNFEAPFTPCVGLFWAIDPEQQRRGYASEAARLALDYGFGNVGLREILAFTAENIRRSRGIMERLGMRHDPADDFDHPRVPEGHPLKRHVLYRLKAPS